ncbi:MAG: Transposase IS200 like protein [Planctomycetes bacterium ADurb.Bin126]|nr:MAG: Transposase IS200 like protein [Planctomycetes bacterium ADurb.Bin126]HOD80812.1 transposase [Phycisphaerae bacterium]HQL72033.1 transposase [Phycisphaerae bacterium]
MVIASHVVISTYGFWLPNDPRGSWSEFVRSWEILKFGTATKVQDKRSHAYDEHDRLLRLKAKQALKFPPVAFTGRQALAVAHGFIKAIDESKYVVYACSIMPDHVHFVIARHDRNVERIAGHLKTRSTQQLGREGLWFSDHRPVWGRRSWKVFLSGRADVARAIAYVERNPIREGKPPQKWSFVTPWMGRTANVEQARPLNERVTECTEHYP